MRDLKKEIGEFVDACRAVASYGLVRCSSGNLSWRVKGGRVLIKASRVWMAEATAGDISAAPAYARYWIGNVRGALHEPGARAFSA